jgi:hypothetical protein
LRPLLTERERAREIPGVQQGLHFDAQLLFI